MKRLIVSLSLVTFSFLIQAQETHDHNHDQLTAPLSVMGSHLHEKGGWMFSYHYMNMEMEGNLDGTSSVSPQEIFAEGFMVAPLSMTMEMHMFGAMYGINDSVSLMVMVPYLKNEMDHVNMANVFFTTQSEGLGDVEVSTTIGLSTKQDSQLLLNAGVSLPTGSIDERDDIPGMNNAKLPYPMQLGSGTYDLLLGLTFTAHAKKWAWGGQAMATLRTGTNDNAYTLGDQVELSGWLINQFATSHNALVKLSYIDTANIDGADPELNPNMVPTADPLRRAGKRADVTLGYTFSGTHDFLRGQNIAFEYSVPVYQNLEGPQLEMDRILSILWQYNM